MGKLSEGAPRSLWPSAWSWLSEPLRPLCCSMRKGSSRRKPRRTRCSRLGFERWAARSSRQTGKIQVRSLCICVPLLHWLTNRNGHLNKTKDTSPDGVFVWRKLPTNVGFFKKEFVQIQFVTLPGKIAPQPLRQWLCSGHN